MNEKGLSDWNIVGNCLKCKAPLYQWELMNDHNQLHPPRWTCGCNFDKNKQCRCRLAEPREQ